MTGRRFTLSAAGRRLEAAWLGPPPDAAPTVVFLHEGLGSLDLWRDFPAEVAARTGCGALVWSRAGYGRSDPCELPRPIEYMHQEAALLPDVLRQAEVREHILLGHSDGASIALIHAGTRPQPGLKGLALEAPHVFVEAMNLDSIVKTVEAYRTGDLRARLARRHQHVDAAFDGWAGAWLDPRFRAWNIEAFLPAIRVPAIVLQGAEDEYGTKAQADAIARQSGAPVEVAMLSPCGHAPHRDQPEATLAAVARFAKGVL
jgi:pimeloyl-ACP methyl ester carboxylesterase